MKRKTAIEECIDAADGELCVPSVKAQARKELRALLALARAEHYQRGGIAAVFHRILRCLARLRRLGVLPEVRRG